MSWFDKLKNGLKKSSQLIGGSVRRAFVSSQGVFSVDDIFDSLIQGDVGVKVSSAICDMLKSRRFESVDVALQEVESLIVQRLTPASQPFRVVRGAGAPTQVVLVSGVNGSGKTTSIAKLSQQCQEQGLSVEWAACDTFRAAAVDQLALWGERLQVPVYTTYPGQRDQGTPAALAYYAVEQARAKGTDVLFVDTAGRLQNNEALMRELERVVKVTSKLDSAIPHQSLLVLDGNTGQNTYSQVEMFKKYIPITGVVVTKLDGTSKAGFLIGLYEETGIPVVAVGVGEQIDDLNALDVQLFAKTLLGLV
ncbi:MAG: signal recognition particle-docking protein FtsY [Holosporales bacterium]|jgi:fused signal recognition particle receptor|nr:signal recognition particle-docking protein FtsY [Holosporales bacterium]